MNKFVLAAAALAAMTTTAQANVHADNYAAEARQTLAAAKNGNCITHDVIDGWLLDAYNYVSVAGDDQDIADVYDLYKYVNNGDNDKVCAGNIAYAEEQLDQVNDALKSTGPNTDPSVIADLEDKKATIEDILTSLNS